MRPSAEAALEKFKNQPIYVAEIGVCRGKNAQNLLDGLNIKIIYLVDKWEPYNQFKDDDGKKVTYDWSKYYEEVKLKFKDRKNVIILKGASVEMAKKVPDESLDYIYIGSLRGNMFFVKERFANKFKDLIPSKYQLNKIIEEYK